MQILCFNNLYYYYMCLETLKILQSRLPSCLFRCYTISSRNMENILLHRAGSYDYFHSSINIWNMFIKILAKNVEIPSIKIATFKKNLKNVLFTIQNAYDCVEWYPDNFSVETAIKLQREGKMTI